MSSSRPAVLVPRDALHSSWTEHRPLIECYLSAGELGVAAEILERVAAERRAAKITWSRREEIDFHILEAEIELSHLDTIREERDLPVVARSDRPLDATMHAARCDVLVDTLTLLASRRQLGARDDARIALLELRLLEHRGRFREAHARMAEVLERTRRAEDTVLLARAHLAAARCAQAANQPHDAAALLRKALAYAVGEQGQRERAEAMALLGEQLFSAGRLTEAAPLLASAGEISRRLGHEGRAARAQLHLARLTWHQGSLARAHDLYERLTDAAESGTESMANVQAQLECGELCIHMGRWPDARRHLLRCVCAARRRGASALLLQAYGLVARLDARRGKPRQASRAIRLAERLMDLTRPPAALKTAVALHLAEAHLDSGDVREASTLATQAFADAAGHPRAIVRVAAHRLHGRIRLAAGKFDEARETFAKAAEYARRAGDRHGRALAELGLAQAALESVRGEDERRAARNALDRASRRLRSMGAASSPHPNPCGSGSRGGESQDAAHFDRRSLGDRPARRPEPDTWAAHGIITCNGRLHAELVHAAQVAPSRLPVLIHGETGSGKELVARLIHRLSGCKGRLVVFNAATCRNELFEAELFGHRKGAFTGAHRDREGLIVQAAEGTLFLDEIADLSSAAQAALLRFLDTGEVRPVGSDTTRIIQPRIVAASHRVLSRLVAEGRFRHDLFFRLAGLELVLPPLRARREDILPLLRHFARAGGIAAGTIEAILTGDFREGLLSHPWPGNVRQLSHWVDQLAALVRGRLPHAEILRAMRRSLEVAVRATGRPATRASAGRTPSREELIRLLRLHRGNISRVAQALHTYRTHVYRLLRQCGIDYRRYRTHTR